MHCDGKFYATTEGVVMNCIYVKPNVITGESVGNNGSHDYWTREVSPDGQTMTVTSYRDKSRLKIEIVNVFDRVK